MPRFRQLGRHEIDQKAGPHDMVTIADRESEEFLTPRLEALMAGSTVVGEEAVSADESIMEALLRPGPCWLIDPVAGSANCAVGTALFPVLDALGHGGDHGAGRTTDPGRN